jgi:hypothetical protein
MATYFLLLMSALFQQRQQVFNIKIRKVMTDD